jgi:murein DD-endopeptidase MepM/ murein hydrolase activator NlpD
MDEIIVRPKYSRQASTNRQKRREPDNDLLSTAFAAKLLVVVVFLSVFALCKAANTPATNFLISKVKIITTSNYDVNKYINGAINTLGITLPQKDAVVQSASEDSNQSSESNSNEQAVVQGNTQNASSQYSTTTGSNSITASTGISDNNSQVQTLEDSEIKTIAKNYAFVTPIKGNIVLAFGTSTYDLSGNSQFHSGIDIEANMGTSINAALGGEVTEVGSNPDYGQYIKITHKDGISTVYAHCSLLIAKKGQKVNQGDVIAKVGDTEGLSGADLHFEVWKDNKAVDPEKLLNYLNQ